MDGSSSSSVKQAEGRLKVGLRNRPRIRWALAQLERYEKWMAEEQRRRQEEADWFVEGHVEQMRVAARAQAADNIAFMHEQWEMLRRALEECRNGNLDGSPDRSIDKDNRPWAMILYERTIDPMMAGLKDQPFLMYGIDPEMLGSTTEEIRGFWLQREANKAKRWIIELRAGDQTHAGSLQSLCAEYGPEFLSLLGEPPEGIQGLCGRL